MVLFVLMNVGVTHADNVYLSYLDFFNNIDGTVRMIRLDEKGNILQGPKVVIPSSVCGPSCLSSISNGGSGRLILITSISGSPRPYARTIVDKNTLVATKTKLLGISISNDTLPPSEQATQNSTPRFVVLETTDQRALAFGLTDKGALDGTSWRVDPRVAGNANYQVGVSPDGRLAWVIHRNTHANPASQIYSQGLKDQGKPNIDPEVSVGSNAFSVYSADLTNTLADNRRLLVYDELTDPSTGPTVVKSQRIDATTGAKIGSPRTIAETPSGYFFVQSLAVDPKGRFLFYTGYDAGCDKILLYFVSLNGSGEASGSPKTILGCGDLEQNVISALDVFVE